MANRRMFSLDVVDTDQFLDMPATSQNLYFHLGMRADDDGFVSSPKKITKLVNCGNDDLNVLLARGFVIQFDDGIVVIRHWKRNNYIQRDRYKRTVYQKQLQGLIENDGVYELETTCIHDVDNLETQVKLGKVREEQVNKTVCSEPERIQGEQASVISLTLNDKTEFHIYEKQIGEWKALFPAVDILQELRKMKSWLDCNPTKRKTKRGILRFVNSWLTREQDSGKADREQKGAKLNDGRELYSESTIKLY